MTPPLSQDDARRFQVNAEAIVDNVARFIQGKREVIALAITCLLAEGPLLLEDVPGVGKTSLARSIAATATSGPTNATTAAAG